MTRVSDRRVRLGAVTEEGACPNKAVTVWFTAA